MTRYQNDINKHTGFTVGEYLLSKSEQTHPKEDSVIEHILKRFHWFNEQEAINLAARPVYETPLGLHYTSSIFPRFCMGHPDLHRINAISDSILNLAEKRKFTAIKTIVTKREGTATKILYSGPTGTPNPPRVYTSFLPNIDVANINHGALLVRIGASTKNTQPDFFRQLGVSP